MFTKEMELVHKRASEDYKEGKKGEAGKQVWAEDEEESQEIAQRKPTPGRGRVSQAPLLTSIASWFLWHDANLTTLYHVSQV